MDYNETNFYDRAFLTNMKSFGEPVQLTTFYPEDFSVFQSFLQGTKIVDICYCNASIDESNETSAENVEIVVLAQNGRLFSLSIFPNLENERQLDVSINEVFINE